MKSRPLVFFFVLYNGISYGQTDSQLLRRNEKFNYKLVIEVPVFPCNILGEKEQCDYLIAEPGCEFTVIGRSDDSVVVRFYKKGETAKLVSSVITTDSAGANKRYFKMHVSALSVHAVRRYEKSRSFTAGTVLIPVKLRLNKFDFSKDITLGPVAGVKFRLSNYSNNFISALAGLGITSITLDEQSTDGRVSENFDVPALTPSMGVVFEFMNSTQAGLFFGWDFISGNDRLNLVHYGKLWVSFGLGFSILTSGSQYENTDDE